MSLFLPDALFPMVTLHQGIFENTKNGSTLRKSILYQQIIYAHINPEVAAKEVPTFSLGEKTLR